MTNKPADGDPRLPTLFALKTISGQYVASLGGTPVNDIENAALYTASGYTNGAMEAIRKVGPVEVVPVTLVVGAPIKKLPTVITRC